MSNITIYKKEKAMTKKEFGLFGEEKAAEYLKKKGYRILERNFSCKLGEVDIIARRGDTISFIEVKTRSSFLYGSPGEAVGKTKMSHIKRVAEIYIRQKNLYPLKVSFDVMEVMFNHIKNAF